MSVVKTVSFLALLAIVLASAIAVVWVRHEARAQFVELSQLQNARDGLNVDFGRLELEQATWADPARIDRVAQGQLHMVQPKPVDIELIRQ